MANPRWVSPFLCRFLRSSRIHYQVNDFIVRALSAPAGNLFALVNHGRMLTYITNFSALRISALK